MPKPPNAPNYINIREKRAESLQREIERRFEHEGKCH